MWPASNLKKAIAQILLDEGYIKSFQVIEDGTQGVIRITLKYLPGKEKVITGLRRVSKPGLRVYAGADELPRVLKGLGIAIISTSKGVMTRQGWPVPTMSAAKSWRLSGKKEDTIMSRIGKMPITVPAGVEINVAEGNVVTVKGPKGTLTRAFHPNMTITVDGRRGPCHPAQ